MGFNRLIINFGGIEIRNWW